MGDLWNKALERAEDKTKPTNPKDALGIKKVPMSTIPSPVLAELGVAMLEGAMKYGRHNYRVIGVRGSVYYDAVMRHMLSWWEGENIDPDSGLNHITKAIASLVVLRDAMIQGNWVDDRPPASKEWINEFNGRVQALINKYPDPVEPYTNGTYKARKDLREEAKPANISRNESGKETSFLSQAHGSDNPA